MPRKTNIKLRRGNYSAWNSVNPILDDGEPAYESTNNTLKIGNSLDSWANLPEMILSMSPLVSQGASKYYPLVLRSPLVNFKSTGETNIFTVPSGYMFLIDNMEVVTTKITSSSSAPYIRFGKTGDPSAFHSALQSQSNSFGARHIINSPQNGQTAGTVVTFGVTTASTAAEHEGFSVIKGYLVPCSTVLGTTISP
jgi:hypothetical protein